MAVLNDRSVSHRPSWETHLITNQADLLFCLPNQEAKPETDSFVIVCAHTVHHKNNALCHAANDKEVFVPFCFKR